MLQTIVKHSHSQRDGWSSRQYFGTIYVLDGGRQEMLPKFLYVLQMVPILPGHDRGLENNC